MPECAFLNYYCDIFYIFLFYDVYKSSKPSPHEAAG